MNLSCGQVLSICLLLLSGAPTASFAQESIYVHGRVQDRNGPPLQGAQLQVLPTGPRAESEPDGSFKLGPLHTGTYQILVRRIGFQPDTVTLTLPRPDGDWVVQLVEAPQTLDSVFTSALDQDLPRVMDRMSQHMGATVFGPDLMKQYPGISIDDILATDSAVAPFLRGAGRPQCYPRVYLNGKPQDLVTTGILRAGVIDARHSGHPIMPDLDIRSYVSMKDVAVIEVYRNERHQIIHEPRVNPREGVTDCKPIILIWTKDFQQKPYKGN